MLALTYGVNPAGWATCKGLSRFWPGCLVSRLNGLRLRDVPDPVPPNEDWVKVRTLLAGICGSDLALIAQKQPPDSLLQAYSSLPTVLGHENVGVVEQVGGNVDPAWVGKRVCVEPTLCCKVRGIEPACPRCQAGEFGACERFGADGIGASKLPPGTSIGYNGRTGGTFAPTFIAHVSQLIETPQSITDEQAILTDPLACSLHAVLRADLRGAHKACLPVGKVLVYGGGMLGLGVVASLRATGFTGEVDVLDVAPHIEPLARKMGASDFVILPRETPVRFDAIAKRTGGTVHRARFGNLMLSGGYDAVFECVGAKAAISESLKWTRARGQMVMVATGHGRGVDLTPIWFSELTVLGSWGRQFEHWQGRRVHTYSLVHEFMQSGKLNTDGLLTHRFKLDQYKEAMETALWKGKSRAIKVAFDFR